MARRSAQVTTPDPRDDIAKIIYQKWHSLNDDRRDWLSRGLEARKYVTASDTNATEVGSLPWKNKTTIPKLTQIVDGLEAYYMAALMPADDWFVWEGRDALSQVKANMIEEYMRTKIRMSGFRNELKKIVRDWVIYGTCFAGVTWVRETTKDVFTGKDIANYVGPKIYRISPVDAAIDPRCSTFDDTPFFERSLVSMGDIIRHNSEVVGPKYDEAVVNTIVENRTKGPINQSFVDFYKEAGIQIDGFSTVDSYLDSGLVELVTFWGDIYIEGTGELLRNRVVTIADGAWVLRNEENPAWNGKKPIGMAVWRILPDNLYGQSPIDNLVGMQYRCDHLENLKADTFDQIVHPVVVVKGDTGENYQWFPGAMWHVPVDGDVDVLRPDAGVLACDNQIALYHNYMEQMAGVPREAMGFRTPGEKTAFEMSLLQQGADRQFIDKVNYFEESIIEPLLNLMFELMIRNFDHEDVIRTFNDEKKVLELTKITRDDVVANGTLRPIGSKHFAARNKRIQELKTLLELAATSGVGMHISGKQAAQMLSEELGWDKYGVIAPFAALQEQFMAEMQKQQFMKQMGMTSETESGTQSNKKTK
jgi:hypothetical protein